MEGGNEDLEGSVVVWVKRKNGSWWPAEVFQPDAVSGGPTRGGIVRTPVKLFGSAFDDIEWYDFMTTKRVKPFRTPDLLPDIEKALEDGPDRGLREGYGSRRDAIRAAVAAESAGGGQPTLAKGQGVKKMEKGAAVKGKADEQKMTKFKKKLKVSVPSPAGASGPDAWTPRSSVPVKKKRGRPAKTLNKLAFKITEEPNPPEMSPTLQLAEVAAQVEGLEKEAEAARAATPRSTRLRTTLTSDARDEAELTLALLARGQKEKWKHEMDDQASEPKEEEATTSEAGIGPSILEVARVEAAALAGETTESILGGLTEVVQEKLKASHGGESEVLKGRNIDGGKEEAPQGGSLGEPVRNGMEVLDEEKAGAVQGGSIEANQGMDVKENPAAEVADVKEEKGRSLANGKALPALREPEHLFQEAPGGSSDEERPTSKREEGGPSEAPAAFYLGQSSRGYKAKAVLDTTGADDRIVKSKDSPAVAPQHFLKVRRKPGRKKMAFKGRQVASADSPPMPLAPPPGHPPLKHKHKTPGRCPACWATGMWRGRPTKKQKQAIASGDWTPSGGSTPLGGGPSGLSSPGEDGQVVNRELLALAVPDSAGVSAASTPSSDNRLASPRRVVKVEALKGGSKTDLTIKLPPHLKHWHKGGPCPACIYIKEQKDKIRGYVSLPGRRKKGRPPAKRPEPPSEATTPNSESSAPGGEKLSRGNPDTSKDALLALALAQGYEKVTRAKGKLESETESGEGGEPVFRKRPPMPKGAEKVGQKRKANDDLAKNESGGDTLAMGTDPESPPIKKKKWWKKGLLYKQEDQVATERVRPVPVDLAHVELPKGPRTPRGGGRFSPDSGQVSKAPSRLASAEFAQEVKTEVMEGSEGSMMVKQPQLTRSGRMHVPKKFFGEASDEEEAPARRKPGPKALPLGQKRRGRPPKARDFLEEAGFFTQLNASLSLDPPLPTTFPSDSTPPLANPPKKRGRPKKLASQVAPSPPVTSWKPPKEVRLSQTGGVSMGACVGCSKPCWSDSGNWVRCGSWGDHPDVAVAGWGTDGSAKTCNKVWHLQCTVNPMLRKPPEADWVCVECRGCHSCGKKVAEQEGGLEKATKAWTVCGPCAEEKKDANLCTSCKREDEEDYVGEAMVQCDECHQWCHCVCESIGPDLYQQLTTDNSLPYVCNKCRKDRKTPKGFPPESLDLGGPLSPWSSRRGGLSSPELGGDGSSRPVRKSRLPAWLADSELEPKLDDDALDWNHLGSPLRAALQETRLKSSEIRPSPRFSGKSAFQPRGALKASLARERRELAEVRTNSKQRIRMATLAAPYCGEKSASAHAVTRFEDERLCFLEQCYACGGMGDRKEDDFLCCIDCGEAYHSFCLDPPAKLSEAARAFWRCPFCKLCEECGRDYERPSLVLCARCDSSYHAFCLPDQLQLNEKHYRSGWLCGRCSVCHCGAKYHKNKASKMKWYPRAEGSVTCSRCIKLRQAGSVCRVCECPYKQAQAAKMLACSTCEGRVHTGCDAEAPPLPSDSQPAPPSEGLPEGYKCPSCRSNKPKPRGRPPGRPKKLIPPEVSALSPPQATVITPGGTERPLDLLTSVCEAMEDVPAGGKPKGHGVQEVEHLDDDMSVLAAWGDGDFLPFSPSCPPLTGLDGFGTKQTPKGRPHGAPQVVLPALDTAGLSGWDRGGQGTPGANLGGLPTPQGGKGPEDLPSVKESEPPFETAKAESPKAPEKLDDGDANAQAVAMETQAMPIENQPPAVVQPTPKMMPPPAPSPRASPQVLSILQAANSLTQSLGGPFGDVGGVQPLLAQLARMRGVEGSSSPRGDMASLVASLGGAWGNGTHSPRPMAPDWHANWAAMVAQKAADLQAGGIPSPRVIIPSPLPQAVGSIFSPSQMLQKSPDEGGALSPSLWGGILVNSPVEHAAALRSSLLSPTCNLRPPFCPPVEIPSGTPVLGVASPSTGLPIPSIVPPLVRSPVGVAPATLIKPAAVMFNKGTVGSPPAFSEHVGFAGAMPSTPSMGGIVRGAESRADPLRKWASSQRVKVGSPTEILPLSPLGPAANATQQLEKGLPAKPHFPLEIAVPEAQKWVSLTSPVTLQQPSWPKVSPRPRKVIPVVPILPPSRPTLGSPAKAPSFAAWMKCFLKHIDPAMEATIRASSCSTKDPFSRIPGGSIVKPTLPRCGKLPPMPRLICSHPPRRDGRICRCKVAIPRSGPKNINRSLPELAAVVNKRAEGGRGQNRDPATRLRQGVVEEQARKAQDAARQAYAERAKLDRERIKMEREKEAARRHREEERHQALLKQYEAFKMKNGMGEKPKETSKETALAFLGSLKKGESLQQMKARLRQQRESGAPLTAEWAAVEAHVAELSAAPETATTPRGGVLGTAFRISPQGTQPKGVQDDPSLTVTDTAAPPETPSEVISKAGAPPALKEPSRFQKDAVKGPPLQLVSRDGVPLEAPLPKTVPKSLESADKALPLLVSSTPDQSAIVPPSMAQPAAVKSEEPPLTFALGGPPDETEEDRLARLRKERRRELERKRRQRLKEAKSSGGGPAEPPLANGGVEAALLLKEEEKKERRRAKERERQRQKKAEKGGGVKKGEPAGWSQMWGDWEAQRRRILEERQKAAPGDELLVLEAPKLAVTIPEKGAAHESSDSERTREEVVAPKKIVAEIVCRASDTEAMESPEGGVHSKMWGGVEEAQVKEKPKEEVVGSEGQAAEEKKGPKMKKESKKVKENGEYDKRRRSEGALRGWIKRREKKAAEKQMAVADYPPAANNSINLHLTPSFAQEPGSPLDNGIKIETMKKAPSLAHLQIPGGSEQDSETVIEGDSATNHAQNKRKAAGERVPPKDKLLKATDGSEDGWEGLSLEGVQDSASPLLGGKRKAVNRDDQPKRKKSRLSNQVLELPAKWQEMVAKVSETEKDPRFCSLCGKSGGAWGRFLYVAPPGIFVHSGCVMWQKDIAKKHTGELLNIPGILTKCWKKKCKACSETGASISCSEAGCKVHMHLPCAIAQKFVFLIGGKVFCAQHATPDKLESAHQSKDPGGVHLKNRLWIAPQLKDASERADLKQWLRVGAVSVQRLGNILGQRRGFHTETHIFPVGYQARRMHWSMREPNRRCLYALEVGDAGGVPRFSISVVGEVGGEKKDEQQTVQRPLVAASADEAWAMLEDRIWAMRKSRHLPWKRHRRCAPWLRQRGLGQLPLSPQSHPLLAPQNHAPGQAVYGACCGAWLFGFHWADVAARIEELKGAEMCSMYRFRHRKELIGRPVAPLASNPSGCARAEPYMGLHFLERSGDDVAARMAAVKAAQLRRVAPAPVEDQSVRGLGPAQVRNQDSTHVLTVPLAMQYRKMRENLKHRVRVGLSEIHGRGLFAVSTFEPDEMVIEYVGELIRPTVSDLREKRYQQQGLGCYFFGFPPNVPGEPLVVDATRRGNAARNLNHSCEANCGVKCKEINGQRKLLIFTRKKVEAGEELTIDYMFKYDPTDEKVPCLCGTEGCSGFLN